MSKNIDIEELITLNYEIEGLLYLALHRGSDTPDGVWRLIEEKVRCLSDSVISEQDSCKEERQVDLSNVEACCEPDCSDSEPSAEVEDDVDVVMETVALNVDDNLQIKDENQAEQTLSDSDEPVASVCEIRDYETPSASIATEEDDAPIAESDETVSDDKLTEVMDTADFNEKQEPVEEQSADDILDDNDELVENSDIPLDDGPEECFDDAEDEPVIRLDEKLARDYSKNLRKAFSLNDKFRFRRELFSNSDTEMADTLNLVEAMSSYSEAEDYFYSDLQWDPEMPEVVDFMAIIKKHFS